MAYIGVRNSSVISSGTITATVAPWDTGTMSSDYQSVTAGTHNIAAGNYSVQVFNEGLNDITVNGDTVTPGNYWLLEARQNPATQRIDYTPAIEIIVPAGGAAAYSITTPSA